MEEGPLSTTKASEGDDLDEGEYCRCCCCLCNCSKPHYADLKCCGCFPIKCGIVGIGLFTCALTIFVFANAFTFIMSPNIHWWYCLVSIVLQVPLIIGLIFFLNWFGEDRNSTRAKLDPACVLAIISYFLQSVWNIIYFFCLYKYHDIVVLPETPYAFTVSKRTYLFWTCFLTIGVSFALGYFICVTRRYWLRRQKDGPEDEKEDEEKKDEMMMDMEKGMEKKTE